MALSCFIWLNSFDLPQFGAKLTILLQQEGDKLLICIHDTIKYLTTFNWAFTNKAIIFGNIAPSNGNNGNNIIIYPRTILFVSTKLTTLAWSFLIWIHQPQHQKILSLHNEHLITNNPQYDFRNYKFAFYFIFVI